MVIKRTAQKKGSVLKRYVEIEDWLSTGSTTLDLSVSCFKTPFGGIPTKRIVEFSGGGASGKTYICGELCGDALRRGYDVVVDDIERRWDLPRLKTFDFAADHKSFKYLTPASSHMEGCFGTMFKVMDKVPKGGKLLYVVDPLAALYSEVELTKSDKMGQARTKALHKNLRHLKDRVASADRTIVVVFSNQLIDAIGVTFGDSKVTPGGNAMVHWPTVRIRFEVPSRITKKIKFRGKELTKTLGLRLRSTVRKNSEDDAFRNAEFTVLYGYGIDDVRDNVLWLRNYTKELDCDKKFLDKKKKKDDDKEGEENKATQWYQFQAAEAKPIYGLDRFVEFIEKEDLEATLAGVVANCYKEWHTPAERKPKWRRVGIGDVK